MLKLRNCLSFLQSFITYFTVFISCIAFLIATAFFGISNLFSLFVSICLKHFALL